MSLSAVYSSSNASLSIKNNRLSMYQIKAPVHWGVNATVQALTASANWIKAPVHWGVNATCFSIQMLNLRD